jgi:hypothetical protein
VQLEFALGFFRSVARHAFFKKNRRDVAAEADGTRAFLSFGLFLTRR